MVYVGIGEKYAPLSLAWLLWVALALFLWLYQKDWLELRVFPIEASRERKGTAHVALRIHHHDVQGRRPRPAVPVQGT